MGTDICVVEAVECPTLLYNGYGEHNIQGIGDKHVPLIHNVMNTDFAIGVSDLATDSLNLLFNTSVGRNYLNQHAGIDQQSLASLADLGLSSIANILGAIKYAKYMDLGPDDAVITVATDGAEMYTTELAVAENRLRDGRFDEPEGGRDIRAVSCSGLRPITRSSWIGWAANGFSTWATTHGSSNRAFPLRTSTHAGSRATGTASWTW